MTRDDREPDHYRIASTDDFAATDPAEVLFTRRRLLKAAGLVSVGGLATVWGVDTAVAAARRTTTTKKRTATTKAPATKSTVTSAAPASVVSGSTQCTTATPFETGGPFPADGSNGLNVLTQKAAVRADIRSSFGSSSATAPGIPLTMTYSLRSLANGCAPIVGAAFYAWHCDRDGNYSLYSPGVEDENFLRGVQVSDADGVVSFKTVFPGAYLGRWPHVHFEIFPTLASATTSRNAMYTSQLAFPQAACEAAYSVSGYEISRRNFPQTPLARDNVFSDGWTTQLATVIGDASKGFVSTLTVVV